MPVNPATDASATTIIRIAIIASTLMLGGCPGTVYAPATELPSLSADVMTPKLHIGPQGAGLSLKF